MKGKNYYVFHSIAILFISFLLFSSPTSVCADESAKTKLPDSVGIGTNRLGSAGHLMASTLGELLKKKEDIKVNVIPSAANMARLKLLRDGDTQFSIEMGTSIYCQNAGIEDFCDFDWGPQPTQMAWQGPAYVGMATTKQHKDINTLKDIKGKRIAIMRNKTSETLVQAYLAFAGYTLDDIKIIRVSGYMDQFQALMSRKVDVVPNCNPATAKLYELEASPMGLKWLPFPLNDKEGWQRLRKIAPWGARGSVTFGPGISKEKPLEAYAHCYGLFLYEQTSPELAYMMTKIIAENLQELRARTKAWTPYTLEYALETSLFPHAYHRGSVKYFKEKGLWTEEHEKRNESLINQQKILVDAWKSLKDKAINEKWDKKKLCEQWTRRQAEITGYRPPN